MVIKKKERSKLEKVILLGIFLGLLGFVTVNFFKEREIVKQQSLYQELVILRQGINMYQMMEHKYPDSLLALAIASYKMPDDDKEYKYIETFQVNVEEDVVDPYGNPFSYDPQTGWVRSTTPGFLDW